MRDKNLLFECLVDPSIMGAAKVVHI